MTNDIVQTDIDLARKLLEVETPAGEVVLALTRRGLTEGVAARLVEDLHAGRTPQATPAPEISAPRRGSSGGWNPAIGPANEQGRDYPRRRRHRHSRRHRSRRESRWPFYAGVAAVGLGALLGVAYLLGLLPGRRAVPTQEDPPQDPVMPIAASITNRYGNPDAGAAIGIEIARDGLQVGGRSATTGTTLGLLIERFGNPSRTNRNDGPGKVIYIFDHHGLLVYSRADGGDDCLMVDFQGLGGEHGAATAFAGKLNIAGQTIHAGTDYATLASASGLGLTNTTSGGRILAGKYAGTGFYCAYLSSTNRLSLVEIDLK